MTLETVLDWLYRSKFALEDGEPLSLKQYLIEIKEVIKAEERIKRIAEEVAVMSDKDKERRRLVLEEEKTEGVGQLIWRAWYTYSVSNWDTKSLPHQLRNAA